MKIDIPGALRSLEQVVERIAELIEWEKLAIQERKPHVPPAFQPADHYHDDLVSLESAFWNLSRDIREALSRGDLEATSEQRLPWEHRLDQLELRVGELQAIAKLIKH